MRVFTKFYCAGLVMDETRLSDAHRFAVQRLRDAFAVARRALLCGASSLWVAESEGTDELEDLRCCVTAPVMETFRGDDADLVTEELRNACRSFHRLVTDLTLSGLLHPQ